MSKVLERLPDGARVAIVRLRSLGDCVLSTPSIHLLKQYRSDLRLAVVSEPPFIPLFEENPDIDDIIVPSGPLLRRWKPTLAINLHGGTRSLLLTTASLARYRVGFAHYRYSLAYNVRIPRAQQILGEERVVHTAEHAASAMFHLGVPVSEIPRARLFTSKRWRDEGYAVIHPYASAADKTWPARRFLEVAEFLRRVLKLEPIFIGGPGDDPAPFQPWHVEISTDLKKTKSLLAAASVFFGNDSGPAHMAAAFGIPVAVLYGPSNPTIWAPWRTEAQVLHSPNGMEGISTTQAVEALARLRVSA
ncbi:MAG: glycosyltransferase family 9 protein [Acidobacteria bacterium]|nr:glycosyltransferase family 9 protein [Acidobacteriota bacterium]